MTNPTRESISGPMPPPLGASSFVSRRALLRAAFFVRGTPTIAAMIEIELQATAVQQALQSLARAAQNLRPALADMGESLINSTRRRFDSASGPDGAPWAANSPVTLLRKRGTRPLTGETGLLGTEIHYQASQSVLRVGSPKEYAAMQHFGGKKSDFPQLWGDIPARPFLGLSQDDEREVAEIALDHLRRAVQS